MVAAVCFTAAFPAAWIIWAVAAFFAWNMIGSADSPEIAAEKPQRKNKMINAEHAYQALLDRARKEAGPEEFNNRKKQPTDLRTEYAGLAAREKVELDKLHQTGEQRQRDKFLDRYFIDSTSNPGVRPAKKAALRSLGIETAADVQWNKVRAVKGFGDVLTGAVY